MKDRSSWSISERTGHKAARSGFFPGSEPKAYERTRISAVSIRPSAASATTDGSRFIRLATTRFIRSWASFLKISATIPQIWSRRKATKSNLKTAHFAAAALLLPLAAGEVCAQPLAIKDFGQLALKCGPNVAPITLASIAQTESGFDPFLVHDNNTKKAFNLETDAEAAELASRLISIGHSVDLGLMQINSHNLPALGLRVQDAFDPCVSIGVASIILSDTYVGGENHEAQQKALRVTISRYNTGDAQRGFTNGYVGKVEASARKVVPALDVGMGQSGVPTAPQPQQVAVPTDPNAPPVWDVWGSFEYSTASDTKKKGNDPRASDAVLFVQARDGSAVFPQLSKE